MTSAPRPSSSWRLWPPYAPASAKAGAIKDGLLAWDGRLSPDSVAAASYSRLRWALAKIVAIRSGLAEPRPTS